MSKETPIFSADEAYNGLKGKLIIILMSVLHKAMHQQLISRMEIKSNSNILDIGCGGGTLLKMLSKKTSGRVTGVDYSPHMVKAAQRRNKKKIAMGSMTVVQASVSKLPIEDGTIDKAVVFETIQFWPDIPSDLKEVHRVLISSGALYIANRFPKPGSRWYDWVQLKSENDYKSVLKDAGFTRVSTDLDMMNNMIVVEAYKK